MTNDGRQIVTNMCDKIDLFNKISESYIQTYGPCLVITEQSEVMLNDLLSDIESSVSLLKDDSIIKQYDESNQSDFLNWLEDINSFISNNRKSINQAKEFAWLQSHILGGLA